MKRKFGFTLGEILVTMVVLGTISVLTVPGLISNTNSKEAYAQVSKAYNMIASATSTIEAQNGRPKFWKWSEVLDEYHKILKTSCIGNTCFTDEGERGLWRDGWLKFITLDGMYWAYIYDSSCGMNQENYIKNACAYFEVDTNGAKGPNKRGHDVFGFVITNQGAYPMGGCPGCVDTACTNRNSWACTATLLKYGKL